MRKKQDIMWEQSTLWESVEKWVTKYLKKSHSEYRELQVINQGDRENGFLGVPLAYLKNVSPGAHR